MKNYKLAYRIKQKDGSIFKVGWVGYNKAPHTDGWDTSDKIISEEDQPKWLIEEEWVPTLVPDNDTEWGY